MVKQYHTRLLSAEFLVRIRAGQPLSMSSYRHPGRTTEARKAGALSGFENREGLFGRGSSILSASARLYVFSSHSSKAEHPPDKRKTLARFQVGGPFLQHRGRVAHGGERCAENAEGRVRLTRGHLASLETLTINKDCTAHSNPDSVNPAMTGPLV